jgi:hypothetical protein
MKIYIVYGINSNVECTCKWNIKAFLTPEKAEEHIIYIYCRWEELLKQYGQYYLIPEDANEFVGKNDFHDYETDYGWEELELDEKLL